jgi:hypothetical protein
MATDILLSNCRWVKPDQIRNFAGNKAFVTWALQFLTFDGNWILLRTFSCSKGELKTLSDAVGEIPPLKYDFQSATLVFYHLSKFHMFTTVQIAELNTSIIPKSDTFEQTLRLYFPDASPWASLGFAAWVYFRSKTHWSMSSGTRTSPKSVLSFSTS